MKKRIVQMALLAIVSACYASCQSHDDDEHKHDDDHHHTPDNSAPIIQITSPQDSAVYRQGDTVPIKALVTDNSLHELQVYVYRIGGDTLMHQITNVHDISVFNLNTFWPSGNTATGALRISVSAQDHGNNHVTQSRLVTLTP